MICLFHQFFFFFFGNVLRLTGFFHPRRLTARGLRAGGALCTLEAAALWPMGLAQGAEGATRAGLTLAGWPGAWFSGFNAVFCGV